LHISGTLYQFTLSASVPVFSTFVFDILPSKGGELMRDAYFYLFGVIADFIDELINALQNAEELYLQDED
jgi:CRISPR/Cas system endoribonuclease Cas6 (RAMP superfamily)